MAAGVKLAARLTCGMNLTNATAAAAVSGASWWDQRMQAGELALGDLRLSCWELPP